MSRTSIIPTAQTKANQATDFYLRADAGGTVNGNLTVEGNITLGAVNDRIVFPVSGIPAGQICIAFVNSTTENLRWGIGTSTAEAGANSGNNFEVFSYNDNGTFFQNVVEITRSSGLVTIGSGSVTSTLSVGAAAGAGTLQVVGPAGAAQVYDEIYNPPVMGGDTLMLSAGADGTIGTNTPFTPTRTGTYVLSLTIQGADNGWTWAAGNSINYVMTYNAGANVVAGAQFYISGLVDPTGMPARGPLAADSFEYQCDILVTLTAGTAYTIAYGATGAAFNLGLGGNIGIVVAPLINA